MIELLSDDISHGIHCIAIKLYSQIVVIQFTKFYLVRSPTMFLMFIKVFLLEIYFNLIQYQHISRYLNTLRDALANHVLDRHLKHM